MSLPDPFPFGAITVAVGPDRNDRFDAATAHFRREDEPLNLRGRSNVTEDDVRRAWLRHVTGADKDAGTLSQSLRRLTRGGMCDEAAVRDLHGDEPLRDAWCLAETGHAVVVSMSVSDLESAAHVFMLALGPQFDHRRLVAL